MRRTNIVLSTLLCVVAVLVTSWASAATITVAHFDNLEPEQRRVASARARVAMHFLAPPIMKRGLAYGNGHVYLVSRSGGTFIRRLDSATGADLGSPLDVTGVSGGTFAVNNAAVGSDGSIYVNNLTTQSTTTPAKVYKWATEGSVPTVAYRAMPRSAVPESATAWRRTEQCWCLATAAHQP